MVLGKQTYGGTRRWFLENHKYRSATVNEHFNGEVKSRAKPRAIFIEEQLQYAAEYEAWKEACNREGAAEDLSKLYGMKRANACYGHPNSCRTKACDGGCICGLGAPR